MINTKYGQDNMFRAISAEIMKSPANKGIHFVQCVNNFAGYICFVTVLNNISLQKV